ncbi:hypothetical protein Micbo1qcDRAFT_210142 [Microdochium bolleyi]|uniref:Uncharacterized protein n=1 Tax=Microdochium bolleyi TaxID=196109 RepID=A0A136IJV6_9PEZI|nr:hypothetical protein Micbo1qcDRAFT_210142 [Microdochium bolleyi]
MANASGDHAPQSSPHDLDTETPYRYQDLTRPTREGGMSPRAIVLTISCIDFLTILTLAVNANTLSTLHFYTDETAAHVHKVSLVVAVALSLLQLVMLSKTMTVRSFRSQAGYSSFPMRIACGLAGVLACYVVAETLIARGLVSDASWYFRAFATWAVVAFWNAFNSQVGGH